MEDFYFYLFMFLFGGVVLFIFIFSIVNDNKETKRFHDSIIKNYSDYSVFKKCYEIDNLYYCTDLLGGDINEKNI